MAQVQDTDGSAAMARDGQVVDTRLQSYRVLERTA